MTLLTIFLMALITFTTRYLFLHPKIPLRLNAKMISFLSFSAPAVLTAIWAPIIFAQNGEVATSLTNPYVLGGMVAVVVSAKTKNLYSTLCSGVLVFILVKFIF